jgi:hypothetical protein
MKKRTGTICIILFLLALLPVLVFLARDEERVYAAGEERKIATIIVDGFPIAYEGGSWGTVGDLIEASGEDVREGDEIFPSRDTVLSSGMKIAVSREKRIRIAADGEEQSVATTVRTVGEVLDEAGIELREDDIVEPSPTALLDRETDVSVIRVEIREETVEKPIPFETVEKQDDDMGWRERVVKQAGENGTREYRYRVSYHDGEEVARKLLGSEVTKEPTDEIVVQGTYVKTGKSHAGAASWYAHTGTMAAANPWLPMGSYVRVTNRANGKSVIVKINDRGPFVPGRIIDLDKVAFQEIASIGAGVIDVKMEEIVN